MNKSVTLNNALLPFFMGLIILGRAWQSATNNRAAVIRLVAHEYVIETHICIPQQHTATKKQEVAYFLVYIRMVTKVTLHYINVQKLCSITMSFFRLFIHIGR